MTGWTTIGSHEAVPPQTLAVPVVLEGSHGQVLSLSVEPRVSTMNVEQSVRIAVAFARETVRSTEARLCTACIDVLGVAGAGVTLMGGS